MSGLAQRVTGTCATLGGILLLVFLLIHLVPGDPVEALLGEHGTAADRAMLRRDLGLDTSLPVQLRRYLLGLAHGELGHSLLTREPVTALLLDRAPYTAALALTALGLAVLLALPLGVWSALDANGTVDRLAGAFALLGGAVPSFVLGPVLAVILGVWAGWLPVAGAEVPGSLILPALTLAMGLSAVLARQLRAALLEILDEPWLQAARARGLPFRVAVIRHGVRNAAIPVLAVLGTQLGALLGGAVITETVFAWPGLGALAVEAIERRDYPVLQGCVLVVSVVYVIVNRLTDTAVAWCDPRIGRLS